MKLNPFILLLFAVILNIARLPGQSMEISAFCIAVPHPDRLEQFLTFMENELAGNGITKGQIQVLQCLR